MNIAEHSRPELSVLSQVTSNPLVAQFQINFKISASTVTYPSSDAALACPIASKLFGFPWVSQVVVAPHFVEVTRQDWISWDPLLVPLRDLIHEHFENALHRVEDGGSIEENRELPKSQMGTPETLEIQKLIDEEINPAVATHGGVITLIDVKDDVVYVQMGGGCQGCGQAAATLKQGVETAIKNKVPRIRAVLDTTDHAGGTNPYYRP